MRALVQGYGETQLCVKDNGIRIWLPAGLFGLAWEGLRERLGRWLGGAGVLVNPQAVMTRRGAGEEAPRWKEAKLDVLSGLVFQLLVPAEHELVRLWQRIDWEKINQLAAPCYRNARGGQRAWAPAQLVAILTVMFLYGIGYETRVVQLIRENLVWCWFCGFGLLGEFPAHDALYDFRQRLGPERFEQLLTLVVQECQAAGLIDNELVSFDVTALVASAHRWSPYERAVLVARTLSRYLERVWAQEHGDEPLPQMWRRLAAQAALEALPHRGLQGVAPERVVESLEQWEQQAEGREPIWQSASEELVAQLGAQPEPAPLEPEPAPLEGEQNPQVREGLLARARQVIERLRHARGDGDARVGRTSSFTWFLGYSLGFVVDQAHQVITAVHLAPGNQVHAQLLAPALSAHIERVGRPQAVALDRAFDGAPVYEFVDARQISAFVASRDHAGPRDGGYGSDRVSWGEASDPPLCPAGQPLQPLGQPNPQGMQVYRGRACADCPLYARCAPGGQGQAKRFSLHPEHHRRWQENRQQCQSEAYQQAHRRRFVAEGRFGLAKQYHHADRAPYRSETMNYIAGILIAWVMNGRVLLRQAPPRGL